MFFKGKNVDVIKCWKCGTYNSKWRSTCYRCSEELTR